MLTALRDAAGTHLPRLLAPLFDSMLWRLPPQADRGVALTFDDGPTEHTGRLLDALASADAKATFFLLGENASRRPEEVRRILEAGHEIGNHSWSHINGWRAPVSALVREYRRTDALLADLAGRSVRWVRPPYGKFTYPLIHWARRRGQRVVLWDTMPCDYSPRATADRVAAGLRQARPRSIVCLHDNQMSATVTPEALRRSLSAMSDGGIRFTPLSAEA